MLNFLIFNFFLPTMEEEDEIFYKNNNSKHLYFSEHANDLFNVLF